MYKILIAKKAQADLDWFRKNDKNSYLKCFDLVREIMVNPREGTGKPERLKYFEKEVYSRRINHKDRLIYTIYEDIKEIDISSFRGHYD
ncbi:Txe/YoeB family addiction module toxin [Desulforhabdus amnigena]|uniref:Putative mRNA interferase YoeB n=1 Tax=Desulforhabdus amnigena TaxID=40218 RepID=A0A9W6FWU1_9BACT|nr:Txe/YoeB family addiction module toxin [Desulforhabdus amnigena]NLJ28676.1 Txe/YoeB family addiction module toxin [Deltaproteobacteria bacterium]GLI36470.1 Txe/YoeB family addiction module toxin [Desulforhabdus amnigena]